MNKQIAPSEIRYIESLDELLECATLTDECVWELNEDDKSPNYIREEEVLFASEEITFGEVYIEKKTVEVEGVNTQEEEVNFKRKSSFLGESVMFLKQSVLLARDEKMEYKEMEKSTVLYIYN